MMFQGEDRQALQSLIDNNTITPEDQKTPKHALKAIQSCIKEEEHFWHFRDEVMSDFRQQPEEQIHALNTRITTLVNNCAFQDHQTKETIKLMLLQHAVKYHEARDWIRLQDQTQLTYISLLQHCKLLEQHCEQFQKAQARGRAELTTLSAVTATTSSIHQDVISINHQCGKCEHKHPRGNRPVAGKECYNCHGTGHYTALCKQPRQNKSNYFRTTGRSRYRSPQRSFNRSPSGQRHSPSRGRQHKQSPNHTRRCRRSPTPKPHQVSHLTADRPPNPQDKLPTDVASDDQMSFHTTVQMITKQGSKQLLVKVNPGADVNTVPLSKYRKLFLTHFRKAGNLKQKILHPTTHTWRAHNETPQQFLGFFIADIHHKTTADVLPVRFYVFKDTTSPKIILSYAASEKLGIVKFQIPNETPTAVDAITTKKRVTFRTPIHTYRPVKKNTGQLQPLKSAIKKHTLQDQRADSSQKQSSQDHGEDSSKSSHYRTMAHNLLKNLFRTIPQ